ncbi:SUMO-activating enzyme subunit 2-like [Bradysia coprophila]|uniref:SUMO-activating enzyme subunit 2-like n=1 Tax=Bradysia coprophila TaxID=38358 RepID=UPI00187D9ED6|nr:SUMO-activating enzyme subunit 2-like [Bradysia coprophila]
MNRKQKKGQSLFKRMMIKSFHRNHVQKRRKMNDFDFQMLNLIRCKMLRYFALRNSAMDDLDRLLMEDLTKLIPSDHRRDVAQDEVVGENVEEATADGIHLCAYRLRRSTITESDEIEKIALRIQTRFPLIERRPAPLRLSTSTESCTLSNYSPSSESSETSSTYVAASIDRVFEENLQKKIVDSKILVVGAGGIGCEVLKNLVLSGFAKIEIIDSGTIDVSNLNLQILFQKEHVGKSKAEVARGSALSFNPNVQIKSYHDSILSTDYDVSFYKRFNVVLNAVDNRQARNHVNRMCVTADVPLIDSGTAGYNGQIELIKKGLSQCYECKPKPTQKTFPGCTIRNTPSEPIHCIVWAKHLFNQLFGESNADDEVSPDTADPEAGGEAGKEALAAESNEAGNVERTSTRTWAIANDYNPEKMFNKLFNEDIKYLLSMDTLWTTRKAPQPKQWGDFNEAGFSETHDDSTQSRDQKIWTVEECANVFATSIDFLKKEFKKLADGDHLLWDKDDKYAMDFVAACANIRSNVFGITQKSRFEIKSMAGNIISVIETTNAITAGIVVMLTFKVLQELYDQCQSAPKPEIVLKVDTKKMTVKSLRDDVLIKAEG